jgi:hypothetical protein
MTEEGEIHNECKNLRKENKNINHIVLAYAQDHKLTLKEVGLYECPNGSLIVDRYSSYKAKALFNEIIAKYRNGQYVARIRDDENDV